jgi:hypothetical protein
MAKNKTTERWLEVVSELKAQNVVDSDVSLSKSVHGLTKQKIYNMRVGDNGVKLEILEAFFESYPQVNANYILTGKEPMFIESENSVSTEEGKGNDNDISLTYDELSRLYKTTVSRYERLFTNLEEQFKELEKTIMEVRENLDNALDDVRVVLNKKKTA